MDPWGYQYGSAVPASSSTSPTPTWGSSLSPLDSMVGVSTTGSNAFFKNSVSPIDSSMSPGSAFRSIYTATANVAPSQNTAGLHHPQQHMQETTSPPIISKTE